MHNIARLTYVSLKTVGIRCKIWLCLGNRSLVAEGEAGPSVEFKLPLGASRMNVKVMSEKEAEGLTEEERKKWFKLEPGESRTIKGSKQKIRKMPFRQISISAQFPYFCCLIPVQKM